MSEPEYQLTLPSDECTCEAKLFYDKYRKQVDAFIQQELEREAKDVAIPIPKLDFTEKASVVAVKEEIRKPGVIVVGRKAKLPPIEQPKKGYIPRRYSKKYRHKVLDKPIKGILKQVSKYRAYKVLQQKKRIRKYLLVSGDKYEHGSEYEYGDQYEYGDEYVDEYEYYDEYETDYEYVYDDEYDEESTLSSTIGSETISSDIETTSSSSGTPKHVKYSKFPKTTKTRGRSLDLQSGATTSAEEVVIQLTKKQKDRQFVTLLKARSRKEGLGDEFIKDILSKAREEGTKEDLLRSLSIAKKEGTLDSLLYKMSEMAEKTDKPQEQKEKEMKEIVTKLTDKGRDDRRKEILLKLVDDMKTGDVGTMTSIIEKAQQDNPDDELLLILAKSIEEDNLNNVVSNIKESYKKGQLNDMLDVLVHKGKREHKQKSLSMMDQIKERTGQDLHIIEELLTKAKEQGQEEQLMSSFMRTRTIENLEDTEAFLKVVNKAVKKDDVSYAVRRLTKSSKPEKEPEEEATSSEQLEKQEREEHEFIQELLRTMSIFAEDNGKDSNFINELLEKAKESGKEKALLDNLKQAKTEGNLQQLISNLATDDSLVNNYIESIKPKIKKFQLDPSSEVDLSRPSDLLTQGYTAASSLSVKGKKLKRKKSSRFRLKTKGMEHSKGKITGSEEEDIESRIAILKSRQEKKSVIRRAKEKILYRRKYSARDRLPSVDYALIARHRIEQLKRMKSLALSEGEEEEEEDFERMPELKQSRVYRESFLRKIYGDRPIGSTQNVVSSSSSDKPPRRKKYALVKDDSVPGEVVPETVKPPSPRRKKKHYYRYAASVNVPKSYSSDSDVSDVEKLLDQKITRVCGTDSDEYTARGYLIGFRYKDDDEDFDWTSEDRKKRKKTRKATISSSESFDFAEFASKARREMYAKTRKIDELFHFLGTHLVTDKPDNPIDYLIWLLNRCIRFRNGIDAPPLIFEERHVESLFCRFDMFNEGFISPEQYKTGMKTLFIKEYREHPRTNRKNMVLKETFIADALKGQRIQLRDMLRVTPITTMSNIQDNMSSVTIGSEWSKINVHDG